MKKRMLSISITIILILTTWISAIATSIQEERSPSEDPIADANGPYSGIVNKPISFDGENSYDPDGSIVSYKWYCGDGHVETGESASHVYEIPGTYILIFTVKDDDDNCDTDTTQVFVSNDNSPSAEFTTPAKNSLYFRNKKIININSSTIVIGPCNITVNATDDVGIQRVEIYIDDDLKHTDFEEPYCWNWKIGLFNHEIKVIVYDDSGHQSIINQTVFKWRLHPIFIFLTLSMLSQGQDNELFSWLPDKESNAISLIKILKSILQSQKEEDSVLLTLLELLLKNDQETIDFVEFLNDHPILKNVLKKQHPLIYNLLLLSDNPWNSNNGIFNKNSLLKKIAILAFITSIINTSEITFGKDKTARSSLYNWASDHPIFTIGTGLVLILLLSKLAGKETDSDGDSDPTEPPQNRAPYADAGINYAEKVGAAVMFSAEDSYDEDGTIISYKWNFGDGSTGSGKTVSHEYDSTGIYNVNLTVTDNDGANAYDTAIVRISAKDSSTVKENKEENLQFWIIAGSLSTLLLLGLVTIKYRRRLFE